MRLPDRQSEFTIIYNEGDSPLPLLRTALVWPCVLRTAVFGPRVLRTV